MSTLTPYRYNLPADRIAQRPVHPYDAARLLVLDPESSTLESSHFYDLPQFLNDDTVLVFNDTKVIPARLRGKLDTGKQVELLCIEEVEEGLWRCMGKPLRRMKEGVLIHLSPDHHVKVEQRSGPQEILVSFGSELSVAEILQQYGEMPIPPYIRKGCADEADVEDYQTMFAEQSGSIAAPTASLHFTESLLDALQARGVTIRHLTLHVGPASFLPIWDEDADEPRAPGSERLAPNPGLIEELRELKRQGKTIVAVGTTVVRALESLVRDETCSHTELFITPGFSFQMVDALITNFHQPGTTHLLLVQALCGEALLAAAYERALEDGYRFLSYGDGMYIRKRSTPI